MECAEKLHAQHLALLEEGNSALHSKNVRQAQRAYGAITDIRFPDIDYKEFEEFTIRRKREITKVWATVTLFSLIILVCFLWLKANSARSTNRSVRIDNNLASVQERSNPENGTTQTSSMSPASPNTKEFNNSQTSSEKPHVIPVVPAGEKPNEADLKSPAILANENPTLLNKVSPPKTIGDLQVLIKYAESGDADSQNVVGACYFDGKIIDKDEVKATAWFRRSANQGYAKGQYNLGESYKNACGVVQDLTEAAKWFRKAADQGLVEAQIKLATLYNNGTGVTKNEVEAVNWFSKAAHQGNAEAQTKLGISYVIGQGVSKNALESVKWLRMAADQDYPQAQFCLGSILLDGEGVAKDPVEGIKLLRKAADQGHIIAQYELALKYGLGNGVTKDIVECYKWLLLSEANGYEDARTTIKEITLTAAQRVEGQRRAHEFKPSGKWSNPQWRVPETTHSSQP